MGNNNLGVSFGSKGSRLQQGLAIEDALSIHVHTGLNVIQSIAHSREGVVESLVESAY